VVRSQSVRVFIGRLNVRSPVATKNETILESFRVERERELFFLFFSFPSLWFLFAFTHELQLPPLVRVVACFHSKETKEFSLSLCLPPKKMVSLSLSPSFFFRKKKEKKTFQKNPGKKFSPLFPPSSLPPLLPRTRSATEI
jgi:hypothetical protein